MSRKVFISVLGTGLYEECRYVKVDKNFKSDKTCFIQEATVQYLNVKDWTSSDLGLFLLTKKAKTDNWDKSIKARSKDNRKTGKKETIPYEGLEKRLDDLKLSFAIRPIDIPDGNNETEIWDIFTKVFNQLQDNDELYFDVTHAFRYLPMLILVLCNYSKFLKNINVRSITYGNYEARNKETNEAPIIDLLPLSNLQDWTYAAGTYMDSGNVDKLVSLSKQELQPILRDARGTDEEAKNLNTFIKYLDTVIRERQTCRGMSIIKSENFRVLKETAEKISKDTSLKTLNPIIAEIKDSFDGFDKEENISNGYFSARWCYDNKLYQQAATILEEVVVSYFCDKHGIALDDKDRRELINKTFYLKNEGKEKDEGDNWEKIPPEEKETVKKLLADQELSNEKIFKKFGELSDLRNDYNHSGMRMYPMRPNVIVNKIEQCLDAFEELFLSNKKGFGKQYIGVNTMPKSFCLLNHPLTQNQLAELKEKFGAEEIIYPSDELSKRWSQIPATQELDMGLIREVTDWLSSANQNDVLIVQGEFGSTFMIVDYALRKNLIPVHAVTKRVAQETREGEVVKRQYVFEHVCFRKYRYFAC